MIAERSWGGSIFDCQGSAQPGPVGSFSMIKTRPGGSILVYQKQMASPDGRLDLEFVPFLERVAATDLLVVASEVHQMFGRYHGTARTDDGRVLHLDGLIGFAEEHHARW